MSASVSADPSGLSRVISLGEAVTAREQPIAGRTLPNFDLTSSAGRAEAAKYYKNLFTEFGTSDAHLAGYNIKFDVTKLIDSARQIPEFMEDPDAVRALGAFEERMISGEGMIDTLQTVRSQLRNQISQRLENARLAGDDYGVQSALALESLMSPSALSKAEQAGEKVSTFGLENIISSTDFLETLAKRAEAGDTVADLALKQLASGSVSHTDYIDRTVTQLLTEVALSPDGVKLAPMPGSPPATGLSTASRDLIEKARRNVAASQAILPTTNLADPRYLTEKALSYLYESPNGLKGVQIEDQIQAVIGSGTPLPAGISADTRGTLKYLPGTSTGGPGRFVFQPNISGSKAVDVHETIARDYIKREIDAARATPPIMRSGSSPVPSSTLDSAIASARTSSIKSLGISPIQQTNIEYTGRFLASGSASTINTGTVLDAARTIRDNERTFFGGMTATQNITGFTSGLSTEKAEREYLVRHPLRALSQSRMEAYQKALYESGIVASSMQPEVRSAAVTLSTITAPLGASNTKLISGAMAHEVDAAGVVAARSAEDVAARVAASSKVVSDNLSLLSETGIVFTQPQKTISIGETVLAIPTSVAKEMKSLDDLGNEVSFIERLKGETGNRSSTVRLSLPKRTEARTPTVNIVYGGSLFGDATEIAQKRAQKEAEEFVKITKSQIEGKTPKEMVEAGLAVSEDQASRIIGQLNDPKAVEKVASSILERGAIIATIDSSTGSDTIARAAANTINNISSGIDADIVAVQKGFTFNVGMLDESGAVLTPRIADEILNESERIGGSLGREVVERSSSTRQVSLLQGAIRRGVDTAGEEGGGFFGRLRSFAASARPDEEISGSSRASLRRFRDMEIAEKMKFLKPKVYAGVAAVALLSTGYYLARRSQKNQAYDETMEQQEFEPGPMSIQDFNNIDQELARQSSSRRDPLVTAGIVGNLDRNKTSHYKMGPNKYSHLYGG